MKIRTTAFALALTMALGLLSACGSKQEATPAPSVPAPDPSISAPAEPDTPQLPMPGVGAPTETPPASEPEAEGSLSLDKSDITLFKAGDSYTLKAEVSGVDGPMFWMSDNDTVATVGEDGTVTAVAPGTATITVTVGNLSAACVVRCKFEQDIPASGTDTPAPAPDKGSVDLMSFYESILASAGENAPFMMELDSEMAQMIYPGIEAVELKQQALYMPGMSAVACEISMVECANAADVETVKSIFQTRINTQVDGGAWYPETIDGWKNNAKIVVKGNYVALFVIPEGMMDAASEFEKLF